MLTPINTNQNPAFVSIPPELPDQAAHAGEFLTTNGTVVSWAPVVLKGLLAARPAQSALVEGTVYTVLSAPGTRNLAYICLKNSVNLYVWAPLVFVNPNTGVADLDTNSLRARSLVPDVVGNVNARLGNNITYWDSLTSRFNYEATIAVPTTHTFGTGAGGVPSAVNNYLTDGAGQIEFRTGAAPAANSTIITINFSTALESNGVWPTLTPGNAATAALTGANQVFIGTADLGSFAITSGTAGLTAVTIYKWYYSVRAVNA